LERALDAMGENENIMMIGAKIAMEDTPPTSTRRFQYIADSNHNKRKTKMLYKQNQKQRKLERDI
jgi:hypothetical protein